MLFPLKDTDLVIWLDHFSIAFEKNATKLGFTPAEVLGIKNDAAMLRYLVCIDLPAHEKALMARKAYKQLIKYGHVDKQDESFPEPSPIEADPAAVKPGIVPRLHEIIYRIKSSPDYTEAMGEELHLTGREIESAIEVVSAKPTGRAIGQADNEVRVEFTKSSFDGVLIESRRTGQDEWKKLATDNFSPYVDSRPLARCSRPEVREYRMRFLLSDEPVGEWSDILVATASA